MALSKGTHVEGWELRAEFKMGKQSPHRGAEGWQWQQQGALFLWATSSVWPLDWGDLEWLVPTSPPAHKTGGRPRQHVSTSPCQLLLHCRNTEVSEATYNSVHPASPQFNGFVSAPASTPSLSFDPSFLYLHLVYLHPQATCIFNTSQGSDPGPGASLYTHFGEVRVTLQF